MTEIRKLHNRSKHPAVPHSGGSWGAKVRGRLGTAMRAKGLTSNRALARVCGVHDRRVGDWLTNRLPSADSLRQIADKLDVSIDWLLGFDVPMSRSERAQIGAISKELNQLMILRRPKEGFAPELAGRDPSQLANEVVDEWWQSRLAARASEAAGSFRELAFEIQKVTRDPAEPQDSRSEASYTINQCLWVAAKLESPLVGWESVADFRFPYKASQHIYRSDSALLETPFRVIGGWAFLWRYPDYDLALYIEAGTAWGAIGAVTIRKGTKRAPRFLVETPAQPVVAKKRAGRKRQ